MKSKQQFAVSCFLLYSSSSLIVFHDNLNIKKYYLFAFLAADSKINEILLKTLWKFPFEAALEVNLDFLEAGGSARQ